MSVLHRAILDEYSEQHQHQSIKRNTSLCDAPRECTCRRVALDYAANLSVPILDRGRNAKRKGDRLLDCVQCMYMCRKIIIIIRCRLMHIFVGYLLILTKRFSMTSRVRSFPE